MANNNQKIIGQEQTDQGILEFGEKDPQTGQRFERFTPSPQDVNFLSDDIAREQVGNDIAELEGINTKVQEIKDKIAKITEQVGEITTPPPPTPPPTPTTGTTGITTPEETPEEIAIREANERAEADVLEVTQFFDDYQTRVDDTLNSTISGIQSVFQRRKKQQEDINKRSLASLNSLGIRLGSSRYAGSIQSGLLTAQEQAGLDKLSEIDREEQQAIQKANTAKDNKDFELMASEMSQLRDIKDKKNNAIAEFQKIALEAEAEAKEQSEKITKQANIAGLISQGILDPTNMFALLNFDAQGNQTGNVTLEEINETKDLILEDNLSPFEKVVDKFDDANGNRILVVQDERTGEFKNISVGLVDKAEPKDDLLSVNEASALGVPFGTKASEAFGIEPKSELTEIQKFTTEIKLGKEFENLIGSGRKSAQQIRIIRTSADAALKAAKSEKSINAASQGVLVAFQKLLDEGSVVRESEYARSGSGASALERIQGTWTKVKQGGAGLTAEGLIEFVELAEEFLVGYQEDTLNQARRMKVISDRQGLDLPSIISPDILKLLEESESAGTESIEDLAESKGFDLEGAKASGATDEEIIEFLNTQ